MSIFDGMKSFLEDTLLTRRGPFETLESALEPALRKREVKREAKRKATREDVLKAKESAKLSSVTASKIDSLLEENKFEEAQALLTAEVEGSESRRASVLANPSQRIGQRSSNSALANLSTSQPLNSIL